MATSPESDYILHSDGTATQKTTGLMWVRCTVGQKWDGSGCQGEAKPFPWSEALKLANLETFAGYDDWRLPSIKELYSLIDFSGTDPSACRSDDGCGAIPFIDDEVFAFDVTRCRYAEMYRSLGLTDLGATLSCNRDGSLIEGFNPNVRFTRTQTIMSGADNCDFHFELAATPVDVTPTDPSDDQAS